MIPKTKMSILLTYIKATVLLLLLVAANSTSVYGDAGDLLWEFELDEGGISTSPVICGERVYFGSTHGKLFCLNIQTGTKLWDYSAASKAIKAIAISNNKILFATGGNSTYDNIIYCISIEPDNILWKYQTLAKINNNYLAISDGKVFVSVENDYPRNPSRICCINAETGAEIWTYGLDVMFNTKISSWPTIHRDKVFFGISSRKFYCLSIRNGERLWEYDEQITNYGGYTYPVVNNDKIYFSNHDKKLYCLNSSTGEEFWEYEAVAPAVYAPVINGDKIYFGIPYKNFYCYNAQTGEKIWEHQMDDLTYSLPAISGNKIYLGCSRLLRCLDIHSGEELWKSDGIGSSSVQSPVISNGKVLFHCNDNKLRCLDTDDPYADEWPMARHDLQNTGNAAHYKTKLLSGFIQAREISEFNQYELELIEAYEDNNYPVRSGVQFSVSDPDIAFVSGNTLTAVNNGCVTVTADYNGFRYEKMFFLMVSKESNDDWEGWDNDTREKADDLPLGEFWKGDTLSGESEDVDYYKLSIGRDSAIINIGFLAEGSISDTKLELLDASEELLTSLVSICGQNRILSRSVPAGDYYLKITPDGDVDQDSSYYISYALTTDIQFESEPNETYQTGTELNQDELLNGILSDNDIDFYTFSLDIPRYIKVDFTTTSNDTEYKVSLFKKDDQNPIDATFCKTGASAFIEVGLSAGKYYLKVEPGDIRGPLSSYTITLTESENTQLEIESNNTLLFANALDSDHPRQGRIYSESDVDHYGFKVTDDEVLAEFAFTSESAIADYTVSITNEDGVSMYQKLSVDGNPVTLARKLPKGNYCLRVEPGVNVDVDSFYHVSAETTSLTGFKILTDISLSAQSDQIEKGMTMQVSATGHYSDATQEPISEAVWSSSDETVATVSQNGLVTGKSDGYAVIYASAKGKAGQISLKVGTGEKPTRQTHGNLILVAGGGIEQTNTLKESIQYLSDLVYRRFRSRFFQDKDIYYFNPEMWHDLDGDGYNDNVVDDDSPTVAEFGKSVSNWAITQDTDGPLYIYLIDHGGSDAFKIFPDEILYANRFRQFVDTFQNNTGRQVVIMIEACKSGTFTDDLVDEGQNRVIVTSTDNRDGYMQLGGGISFTRFFIDRLLAGDSVYQAWMNAEDSLSDIGIPYSSMTPQLVEGVPSSSTQIIIGGNFGIISDEPEFIGCSANEFITPNTPTINLYADVVYESGIEDVWAVVLPPDYAAPGTVVDDFETPDPGRPTLKLEKLGQVNRYEASYSDFTAIGEYKFYFFARGKDGNENYSKPTVITILAEDQVAFSPGPGLYQTEQRIELSSTFGPVIRYTTDGSTPDETSPVYELPIPVTATMTINAVAFMADGISGQMTTGEYTISKIIPSSKGDINGDDDGKVDLTDALVGLQAMAGIESDQIRSDYAASDADVNGDGRIGLEEIIYILRETIQSD